MLKNNKNNKNLGWQPLKEIKKKRKKKLLSVTEGEGDQKNLQIFVTSFSCSLDESFPHFQLLYKIKYLMHASD